MTDKRYNGWANYETWLIGLWLGNDQGTQEHWEEEARAVANCALHALPSFEYLQEHYLRDPENVKQGRVSMLSDRIKDEIEEYSEEGLEGFRLDLMGAALSEVDWQEIAEHYLDAVEEAT